MNIIRIGHLLLFIITGQLFAAEPLTGDAYHLADQAYKAINNGKLEEAHTAVTSALKLKPGHSQLLSILAQIQSLNNELDNAIESLSQALVNDSDNAQIVAQRGYLYIQIDEHVRAINDLENALKIKGLTEEQIDNVSMSLADLYAMRGEYKKATDVLAPLVTKHDDKINSKWLAYNIYQDIIPETEALIGTPEVNNAFLNKAYEAMRENNLEHALELFLLAERFGGLTSLQYGDAGYIARRLFNNQEATRLFIASIQSTLDDPDGDNTLSPPLLFGLRRAVDDLSRRWGFLFSTFTSDGGNTAPGTFGQPGSTQAGAEIYYQPENFGYRDGKQFQVFARTFQTLDNDTGLDGIKTNQGAVGVRWKALRDYNLVLTAERLFSIGRLAEDDWLFRIGFSIDDGVDIQPFLNHWPYRTVFAESAYFVNEDRLLHTFEARYGHSFRFDTIKNLIITPHAVYAADYDTDALEEFAAGIGIGTNIRLWFRESEYRAPASYIDLSLQYRQELVEDTGRQDGIFFRTIFWY